LRDGHNKTIRERLELFYKWRKAEWKRAGRQSRQLLTARPSNCRPTERRRRTETSQHAPSRTLLFLPLQKKRKNPENQKRKKRKKEKNPENPNRKKRKNPENPKRKKIQKIQKENPTRVTSSDGNTTRK